ILPIHRGTESYRASRQDLPLSCALQSVFVMFLGLRLRVLFPDRGRLVLNGLELSKGVFLLCCLLFGQLLLRARLRKSSIVVLLVSGRERNGRLRGRNRCRRYLLG